MKNQAVGRVTAPVPGIEKGNLKQQIYNHSNVSESNRYLY